MGSDFYTRLLDKILHFFIFLQKFEVWIKRIDGAQIKRTMMENSTVNLYIGLDNADIRKQQ